MKTLFLICLAVGVSSLGEARDRDVMPSPDGQSIDLTQETGTPTTIRGTARDSKGGAVIVPSRGEPVYIDGLDSWPAEAHGKRVTVSGLLKRRKSLPDPTVEPAAVAPGMKGLRFVLEKARWKVED